MKRVETPSPWRLVWELAARSLRHEWILSLCLVIALAAVLAPQLVLLGLKFGTIETLRLRLVEDPVFRELRPAQTREYTPQWIDAWKDRPGVGFMVPTILPLSSVISVQINNSKRSELLDLVPTAAGDPLLLENGARIPLGDEIVLTSDAARRLGVGAGDRVKAQVTRSRAGRNEQAQADLHVVAVLPPRAGSLARVYAPLDFVVDVEAYKEGYGVAYRGWSGDKPEPYLSFDGVVLLLDAPLTPINRSGLIINTGFGRILEMDVQDVVTRLGFVPPDGLAAYDLHTPGSTVTLSNLRAIEQKLRGQNRILLPYAGTPELKDGQGSPISLIGVSVDREQSARLGLPALPWGALDSTALDGDRLLNVLWPDTVDMPERLVAGGVVEVDFPVGQAGISHLSRAIVPVELLGVLRTAGQRALQFDELSSRFEMARGGYRGFRLYARSIDDVPALYRALQAEGIENHAEVEAIERIQVLDSGLNQLFWLIAVLGISGGTAVLVASLYAAVERHRRHFGVMRLLGLSRNHVFFFPVAQGVMIASAGLATAFCAYYSLASVINRKFAHELSADEAFCYLPVTYVLLVIIGTLILAILASLVAAWRTTRVDPAEVIREQ